LGLNIILASKKLCIVLLKIENSGLLRMQFDPNKSVNEKGKGKSKKKKKY
jgi:hypothetical protein